MRHIRLQIIGMHWFLNLITIQRRHSRRCVAAVAPLLAMQKFIISLLNPFAVFKREPFLVAASDLPAFLTADVIVKHSVYRLLWNSVCNCMHHSRSFKIKLRNYKNQGIHVKLYWLTFCDFLVFTHKIFLHNIQRLVVSPRQLSFFFPLKQQLFSNTIN